MTTYIDTASVKWERMQKEEGDDTTLLISLLKSIKLKVLLHLLTQK